MAIGQASSFAPDAAKAQKSAQEIFRLLDRKPAIDIDDESSERIKPEKVDLENTVMSFDTEFQLAGSLFVRVSLSKVQNVHDLLWL